jgi:hypothetical protein
MEALLESVLDRLGGYRFEPAEEAEDAFEAVEYCRNGEGEVVGWPSRVRGVLE